MFGKLKGWRRIHTRYDRCDHSFMSGICIAATVIFWLNQSVLSLYEWLHKQKMSHIRSSPFPPKKNHGKIEHWHQTIKNCVLLENDYLPGNLEHQIRAFVEYYNNHRYHESLSNIAPADVYFGRDKTTMRERQEIKNKLLKEDFEKTTGLSQPLEMLQSQWKRHEVNIPLACHTLMVSETCYRYNVKKSNDNVLIANPLIG